MKKLLLTTACLLALAGPASANNYKCEDMIFTVDNGPKLNNFTVTRNGKLVGTISMFPTEDQEKCAKLICQFSFPIDGQNWLVMRWRAHDFDLVIRQAADRQAVVGLHDTKCLLEKKESK
jgi:hypothetical protein